MATLFTSAPMPPIPVVFDISQCDSTIQRFKQDRISVPFNHEANLKLESDKERFNNLVVKKSYDTFGGISIARYFIVSLKELKTMMEMTPEADFIHFHNTLAEDNYNFLYAIPVNSALEENHREVMESTTILIASFPCPPDRRCPPTMFNSL